VAMHAAKHPHGPIHVKAHAIEKALEQAKGVVLHSLQHGSLHELMELVPSPSPAIQGLMGELSLVHKY
jgi:hypothetical protein